ncbi:MAG: archaemetzincin family Zn-dependent metalloprotease [Promethearchaeota archaeon]|jgi:archaemetzincin
MERIIYLQKIGKLNQSLLIKLKSRLELELKKFNIGVKINKDQITLTDSEYNKSKERYSSLKILKKLRKEFLNKEFFRILGILDKDIYSKKYNFVFGLANMRSGVALISLTRLREKFYKETGKLYRKHETAEDIEDGILKEALHELGHTFGLKHCNNMCVMQFSDSLKEIDKKIPEFCNSCLKLLKEALN